MNNLALYLSVEICVVQKCSHVANLSAETHMVFLQLRLWHAYFCTM